MRFKKNEKPTHETSKSLKSSNALETHLNPLNNSLAEGFTQWNQSKMENVSNSQIKINKFKYILWPFNSQFLM